MRGARSLIYGSKIRDLGMRAAPGAHTGDMSTAAPIDSQTCRNCGYNIVRTSDPDEPWRHVERDSVPCLFHEPVTGQERCHTCGARVHFDGAWEHDGTGTPECSTVAEPIPPDALS